MLLPVLVTFMSFPSTLFVSDKLSVRADSTLRCVSTFLVAPVSMKSVGSYGAALSIRGLA